MKFCFTNSLEILLHENIPTVWSWRIISNFEWQFISNDFAHFLQIADVQEFRDFRDSFLVNCDDLDDIVIPDEPFSTIKKRPAPQPPIKRDTHPRTTLSPDTKILRNSSSIPTSKNDLSNTSDINAKKLG